MTLRLCPDLSPADWITSSTVPWEQLVGFGAAGFPAYARLRFIPDPTHPGQSENDVDVEGKQDDNDQLALLFDLLASGTSTPEGFYFCLWDGWGTIHGSPAVAAGIAGDPAQVGAAPSVAPAFGPQVMDGPKVVVPNRA